METTGLNRFENSNHELIHCAESVSELISTIEPALMKVNKGTKDTSLEALHTYGVMGDVELLPYGRSSSTMEAPAIQTNVITLMQLECIHREYHCCIDPRRT